MILQVAALDLFFAGLALLMRWLAPSDMTRMLCGTLAGYCIVEMLFHRFMENAVASVMLAISVVR